MSMTLKGLKTKEKPVPVEYEGDTLNITYRPGEFTPKWSDEFSEDDDEETNIHTIIKAILKVIGTWDMLDKPGGELVPLTEDILTELPSRLITNIFTAISLDMSPNPTTAETSSSS